MYSILVPKCYIILWTAGLVYVPFIIYLSIFYLSPAPRGSLFRLSSPRKEYQLFIEYHYTCFYEITTNSVMLLSSSSEITILAIVLIGNNNTLSDYI